MAENKRYPKIWEDANENTFHKRKKGSDPEFSMLELSSHQSLKRFYDDSARLMAKEYETEISEKDKRIEKLEAINREAIDLLRQSYSIIDKRPLVDKLMGKNPIPESQKSSWQKRTEKLLDGIDPTYPT